MKGEVVSFSMSCLCLVGLLSAESQAEEAPVHELTRHIARPQLRLMPQHWALGPLSRLSQRGVITGVPYFMFEGGRSWTRQEVAVLLGQTLDAMKRKGADPDRETIVDMRLLMREFEAELELLGVNGDFDWADIWKMRQQKAKEERKNEDAAWRVTGSSTTSYTHTIKTQDADWKENLNLGIRSGAFKFDTTLLANREETDPFNLGVREYRLAPKTKGTIDRYALTWDAETQGNGHLQSIFGFTGGSSWSRGLVVGNLNLEGANFLWDVSDQDRVEVVLGRTQGDNADHVIAAHWKRSFSPDLKLTSQLIEAWYNEGSSSSLRGLDDEGLLGFGLEWKRNELELSAEVGLSWRGGRGVMVEILQPVLDWGELKIQGHAYEDFEFDYHSPETYGGISGGDDVQEKSVRMEFDTELMEKLRASFVFDSSVGGSQGTLLYGYNEWVWETDWVDMNASYEQEWAPLFINKVVNLRFNRSWDSGWRSSLDWAWDETDGAISESTRLALYWDMIRDILSMSSSLSRRSTATGDTDSEQFGLNWNLSSLQFLSLQASFGQPDASDNHIEFNYLVKF